MSEFRADPRRSQPSHSSSPLGVADPNDPEDRIAKLAHASLTLEFFSLIREYGDRSQGLTSYGRLSTRR